MTASTWLELAGSDAAWVERLGWTLLHSLWQGTTVAVLLALALRAMRSASPQARYLAACAALLLATAAPAVTFFAVTPAARPSGAVGVGEPTAPATRGFAEGEAASIASPSAPGDSAAPPAHRPETPTTRSEPAAETSPSPPFSAADRSDWAARLRSAFPAAVAAWLAGVALMSIRLVGSCVRVRQLRTRGAAPAAGPLADALERLRGRLGVSHPVTLLESALVEVPTVFGWLRPVILLPVTAVAGMPASQVEAVLAHELAHVRRGDYLVNLFQNVAEAVLFYHPAVWWVSARVRAEREHCCDDLAVAACGDRRGYAAALLRLEELRPAPAIALADVALGAGGGDLLGRVRRLAGRPERDRLPAWWPAGLIAAAVAAAPLLAVRAEADAAGTTVAEAAPDATASATEAAAEATNDDVARHDLTGTLVGPDGAPVAGARVLLRSGGLQKATSDAWGRFRFEELPPSTYGYEIWAFRDDLVTPRVPVEAAPLGGAAGVGYRPMRLEMAPGRRASFVVVAMATGEPIRGAVVRFGYPDRRTVTTGDEGTASERGLLPQAYDVTIEAEGYARSWQQLDLGAAAEGAEYRVALEPGGTVVGVALDESGRPVAGADVVYREEGSPFGLSGDAFRTDEQGRFRHRFLPVGTAVEVSVSKDGYDRVEREVVLSAERPSVELELKLATRPKGGAVAGRVSDRDGAPIANARVSNWGTGSDDDRSTVADAEGRFALSDLQEGFAGVRIAVAAPGFAPRLVPVEPRTDEAPAEVAVTLEPGHSVRGVVLDERRSPVAGAYVMARSEVYRHGLESVRTDAAGAFAFDSLPGDVVFEVSAAKRPSTGNLNLALDGSEPVEVVLEPPGAIRGRVVDAATGRPLPQFRVRVGASSVRRPGDVSGSYAADLGEPGRTFRSDDGRFAIEELKAGMPFELIVEADGYERTVVDRAVAAAEAGAEDVEVSLAAKAAKPYSITVEMLDHEGRPVPGAQLRLIVSTTEPAGPGDNAFNWSLIRTGNLAQKSYCEQFLSGETDAAGRFVFGDVVPDRHLQLVYWGEGVPADRSLFGLSRAGEADVETVEFPAPATVRGTVDRDAFPVAASVRLSRPDYPFQYFEAELGRDGTEFELTDLPPGRYTIQLEGKPVAYTENGHQMSRSNPLVGDSFVLRRGEVREVRFGEE